MVPFIACGTFTLMFSSRCLYFILQLLPTSQLAWYSVEKCGIYTTVWFNSQIWSGGVYFFITAKVWQVCALKCGLNMYYFCFKITEIMAEAPSNLSLCNVRMHPSGKAERLSPHYPKIAIRSVRSRAVAWPWSLWIGNGIPLLLHQL